MFVTLLLPMRSFSVHLKFPCLLMWVADYRTHCALLTSIPGCSPALYSTCCRRASLSLSTCAEPLTLVPSYNHSHHLLFHRQITPPIYRLVLKWSIHIKSLHRGPLSDEGRKKKRKIMLCHSLWYQKRQNKADTILVYE